MKAAAERCLRATALQHGLDPDKTLPEDILLLAKDKDGTPLVSHEYDKAVKKAEFFREMSDRNARRPDN